MDINEAVECISGDVIAKWNSTRSGWHDRGVAVQMQYLLSEFLALSIKGVVLESDGKGKEKVHMIFIPLLSCYFAPASPGSAADFRSELLRIKRERKSCMA